MISKKKGRDSIPGLRNVIETRLIRIAHLGRQRPQVVFVQKMPQRPYLHLKQIGGLGLITVGLAEGFDHVGLLEVIEMHRQVQAIVRKIELLVYPLRIVICDVFRKAFREYEAW